MKNEDAITFIITQEDVDQYKRLDHFLAQKIPQYSRTFLKKVFEEGLIHYSHPDHKASCKLELKKMPLVGSIVEIEIPPAVPIDASAENIPLPILFQDEHLVIIDKPAGLVTHPAPGNWNHTLVNAILYHCPDLQRIGDKIRPGIVHRLDKGTSGVMVVAKNMPCMEGLITLFSKHDIERRYHAFVLDKELSVGGTLQSNIGRDKHNRLKMAVHNNMGRHAVTHYRILKRFQNLCLLELNLETGRTHQIRVHLASLLHSPILLDDVYGNPKTQLAQLNKSLVSIIEDYPYPLLHAKVLGFTHPITGEKLRFESPYPVIFKKLLELNND